MLRTLRRTYLAAAVAAALLLIPAVPALAAPPLPIPGSIVDWLLDQLPWAVDAAKDRAGAVAEMAPSERASAPATLSFGDGDLGDISAADEGLPGPDPNGLSEGEGLPGLDPDG